jgi:hypothetical protein
MAGDRDPTCKTPLKWVTETVRRMTWKRACELWERGEVISSNMSCCKTTERGGHKTPSAMSGHLGLKFYSISKAKTIVGCLENVFILSDLCNWPWTKPELCRLPSMYSPWKIQTLYLKEIETMKLGKAYQASGSSTYQEDLLFIYHIYFITVSGSVTSWHLVPKHVKDAEFSQTSVISVKCQWPRYSVILKGHLTRA